MRKLSLRMLIIFLISILLALATFNFGAGYVLKSRLQKQEIRDMKVLVNSIIDEYVAENFGSTSTSAAWESMLWIAAKGANCRILIVNSKGVVVSDAGGSDGRLNGRCVTGYDPDVYTKSGIADYDLGGMFQEPGLFVSDCIIYDYSIRGYVMAAMPDSVISSQVSGIMDAINICCFVLYGVICATFIYLYITLVLPLVKLKKALVEYAKGNFQYPLKMGGSMEYTELADTVRYTVDELKQMDDYRKRFVANVSHDFRSPLTSIRGYAQAMLDGTIPWEKREKYLNIVQFETERLTKLTEDLLELNRLDSGGMVLRMVDFDINRIIKSTATSFEGRCKEKHMVIKLVFFEDETLVHADKERIQQVLYNIIDNAVKFSNQDSRIVVTTREKGEKVMVSIKDFGQGIPKDSIGKIWDRFYKSDSSRGKDKKGTGLGLSIVKEIITAHDENISVVSTEGAGTEFSFTLTMV